MRRLRDLTIGSGGSWGGRIAKDEEPTPTASLLPAATAQNVGWARSFWPEADEDEFEWGLGRMRVRRKADGAILRIKTGLPMGGELASGVRTWLIRDGRLLLLEEPGGERPTTSSTATYMQTAPKVEYTSAAPAEGSVIL